MKSPHTDEDTGTTTPGAPSGIARAAVWFGNFGSVVLRFVLSIAIARLAGAEQMGIYVAISALTFIVSRVTDLGLPNAVVYFVRSQRTSTRRCLWVCLLHSMIMLPASMIVLLGSAHFGVTSPQYSELIASSYLFLGVLTTVQLLGGLLSQLLIPLNGFKSFGVVMTISPAITMAACFLHGRGIDASQVLYAVLTGEAVAALLGLALVLRSIPEGSGAGSPLQARSIYSYAIKTYVGTSMKALAQRGDRLILSWFVPSSLLAAYSVAMSLRDSAMLPITTHSMLLRNQLIDRQQHAGDREEARAHLKIELIRWSIISALIAVALALTAPFVLPALYGREFESPIWILIVLSAALPMMTVATFCWTALLSAGKAGAVSFGLILGGTLHLIGFYVGATMGGTLGACYGALVASIVAAAWWLVVGFKR